MSESVSSMAHIFLLWVITARLAAAKERNGDARNQLDQDFDAIRDLLFTRYNGGSGDSP